jgi:hypothetical protein
MDDTEYAKQAIEREIANMPTLPYSKVGHPRSALYASMVRIASLAKLGGLNQGTVGAAVVAGAMAWAAVYKATPPPRELWRQWRNAYRFASPRERR